MLGADTALLLRKAADPERGAPTLHIFYFSPKPYEIEENIWSVRGAPLRCATGSR